MSETRKRWSLQGTTALVTGGTKGIGRAVVEELAEFGASVHTCARNEEELRQRLRDWTESGYRVTGSVCDVSSRAAREKLIEEVSNVFQGKLNILINNVGGDIIKTTVEYTAEDYSYIMSTTFESAYHLSQLSHPLLKASRLGNIVFISSVAGLVAVDCGTIYSAAKGALNQLTKNLACEWAKDNIRTNCVAPWLTITPAIDDIKPMSSVDQFCFMASTPLYTLMYSSQIRDVYLVAPTQMAHSRKMTLKTPNPSCLICGLPMESKSQKGSTAEIEGKC